MTRKPTEGPDLFLFAEALVEDLMTLSDEKLLEEMREDGIDPESLAGEIRKQLQEGVVRENKARLAKARDELNAARATRANANVVEFSLFRKQQILSQFAATDHRLNERLTMAARNGEGASEREINDILKDLIDLGAIDDEGNSR